MLCWCLYEQAEDDQERFERMQKALLMANPESVAFYNAQMRTRRRVCIPPSSIHSFIHFFSFIYLHQTAGPYQVKQTTKETHAQHTRTSKMEHKSLRTQWHHSRYNSIITSQRNVFKTTGKIMHYMRTTPVNYSPPPVDPEMILLLGPL